MCSNRPGFVYSSDVSKNLVGHSVSHPQECFRCQSKPASPWMLPSESKCRKSGHKKSSRGLIDEVGIISTSLHLYLPLGFCRREVDLILNLYKVKEREFPYGNESYRPARLLLKIFWLQHYTYHRVFLWKQSRLLSLAPKPSSVLPGQSSVLNQNQNEGVNPPEGLREIWWKYWILVRRLGKKNKISQDKRLEKSTARLTTFPVIPTVK